MSSVSLLRSLKTVELCSSAISRHNRNTVDRALACFLCGKRASNILYHIRMLFSIGTPVSTARVKPWISAAAVSAACW